ncbi:unnamed protein product [Calypogeia fissa]
MIGGRRQGLALGSNTAAQREVGQPTHPTGSSLKRLQGSDRGWGKTSDLDKAVLLAFLSPSSSACGPRPSTTDRQRRRRESSVLLLPFKIRAGNRLVQPVHPPMKRHLTPEESDESRSKSRRILDSRNREEEEEPGGFLDLNTTPRGFDLNAPVAEDENSHGQSGWLPAQDEFEGKRDTTESHLLVVEEVAHVEASTKVEIDAGAAKSEDSEASTVPLERAGQFQEGGTEEARGEKEDGDEPELLTATESAPKLSILATSILQRTLEPASNLGIDEDLDIIRSVWSAQQQSDMETLDSVVSEACEELSKSPSNPSRYHYLSCLYISKKLPEAFGLPKTFKVLLGFLRNAAAGQLTGKRQMMLPILASKLLLRAFANEPDWPLELVQMYLEDATMSRSWIEHDGCKEFVSNILTAFPDVDMESPSNTDDATIVKVPESQGGPGESAQGQAVKSDAATTLSQGVMPAKNRYPSEEIRARVRTEFLHALNQLLGSAATKDNPRQLLKLLMQGAGYEEVRVVASSMLEGYLNNPVHLRAAKALLDRILQHTRGSSDNDLNTVANLLALRITTMQPPGQTKSLHGNIFGDMVNQLVKRRPEFTTLALKTFVTAEVNNRNPHNLKSIVMVLKAMQESPPPEYELALILQELAANDDYRLQLRDLMRRMMKQVGTEIDVHALCHGLMQPWPAMGEQHEVLKEAWLKQLVDLSCQLLLHAAVPFALDEAVVSALTSSSSSILSGASNSSLKEKLLQVEKFSHDTANFQVEAVAWCTDVLAVYLPSMDENEFTRIVRQLLFLENSEVYLGTAENVSEVDLVSFRLLSSCLPAPEEILARLILMAISNYPLSQSEALKLIERLVWRAASLKKHMDGALTAASAQLPAAIFKLASFNLPGVIQQPVAQLVVKDMYWRACLVVLIIAAYNPGTIGWFVWENLPTIRCLMEALLTCTRSFLPIGVDTVIFSEVKKLELEAEQRDSKAEEAISAFLDVVEKRRNDPTSTDSDTHGTPLSWPGSHSTSQSGEWKGKVMFLNQTGSTRRPPKSAVEELDRADATYQLGHLLRKSRSPDFFAEITKQQTLPQAWPWLRRILVQAPDVISFLPPVWQCELLFMHEGQYPLVRKLSLDIGKLLSCLRQVIVNQQTNEAETESVVGFLARKLVAKSGGVRVQARRCFSCLLDVLPSSASDLNTSVPSSPQDSKRVDPPGSATVNVVPLVKSGVNQIGSDNVSGSAKKVLVPSTIISQGPNTIVSALHISSANSSSVPGGNLRVSPGVNHASVTKDGEPDKVASWTQAASAGDECRWLENLEKWPNGSRVVSVLVPAIQRAVQQENRILVVVAYLDFLKKHLSRISLACCLASFIVHREMVAASLLLGPASSFILGRDEVDSRHVSRAVTIELVVESLCKAVESGTVNDVTWNELGPIQSPIVTLVLPHITFDTKELALMRVNVHKVVIDAAVEVLSLLGQEEIDDKTVKLGFQQLLNLVFPSFNDSDQTWRWDVDIPVGWLEEGSVKRPILSECQAKSFVRSKNARLVKAGLSILSIQSKLELCESFGLSSEGAATLLTDLNNQKDMRLEMFLRSGSFAKQRLKKLRSCVQTIVKAEKDGDGNLLRILEHLTIPSSAGQPLLLPRPTPGQEQSESSSFEPIEVAHPSGTLMEEILDYVFGCLCGKGNAEEDINWQKFWDTPGYYLQLRKYLQTMMICGWEEGINNCVMKVFSFLDKAECDRLANWRFLSLGLPIVAILSQYTAVPSCSSFTSMVTYPKPASIYIRSNENSHLALSLRALGTQNRSGAGSKVSGIFASASILLGNLEQKLADIVDGTASVNSRKNAGYIRDLINLIAMKLRESAEGTEDTGGQEIVVADQNITSKVLELASVSRIEALVRILLRQNLASLWDESSLTGSSDAGSLPVSGIAEKLVGLLRKWRSRDGLPAESVKRTSPATGLRAQVEYSGLYGLVMEILGFLDQEFLSEGLLLSLLDISRLQGESRECPASCTVPVALTYVLHQTSWNTLSRVFHFLLGTEWNSGTSKRCKPGSWENGDCCHTIGDTNYIILGQEAVLEFISLCVQHPRAKLVDRQCDMSSSSKLVWSWVDPSAARVLTNLAILACAAAKLGNDTDSFSVTSSNLWIQQYVGGLERQTLSPYKRCLKILLLAASQGSHITGAIVQELNSYEDSIGDEFTDRITKTFPKSATRAVAQGFREGLYLAFPVSVKAVLSDSKLLLNEEKKGLSDIHSMRGQTCSLDIVIHNALRSMCTGNEKESNAAYGFCQEFARQHPLLVMPHLLTLRLLLKELLPLLRQGALQSQQPWNNVSYPQPASSSIALDDILKVRTQLQQCIELYAGESRKEQGLFIYSREKPIQVFKTGGNDFEEGNLVATLNDLERASARMPAILTVFEDSLVKLTMVKDSPIRERIYSLLERSLLHCPSDRSASNIVQGLLQQLRSSDVARAKSAARNASRFFHFSPELQESILVEMLQLGIVASEELQQLLQGLISVASFTSV